MREGQRTNEWWPQGVLAREYAGGGGISLREYAGGGDISLRVFWRWWYQLESVSRVVVSATVPR